METYYRGLCLRTFYNLNWFRPLCLNLLIIYYFDTMYWFVFIKKLFFSANLHILQDLSI